MQKKEWIPVGLALLLLVIGALYDYQITDTLYQLLPVTGMIFERFLLIPVQMMTVIAMAMLFRVKGNAFYLLIGYVAASSHSLPIDSGTAGNFVASRIRFA